MRLQLTKDQLRLRQDVISFARDNLNGEEHLEKFSPTLFKKVADFGLLGMIVSEEFGGLNESYLTAAIVFEALGYACKNNGLVFAINNHIWVAQNIIFLYGNKELTSKYVPSMVSGKKIGAVAITETEAGSDAMNMSTNAIQKPAEFILNGSKTFISNGPVADVFIVFAVTETHPIRKLSAFVVEREFEGVFIGSDIEKMGLSACPTSEVVFRNCRIPRENLLGHFNMGNGLLTSVLEWERFYEFVPHVGVMQRIMEQCIEHSNIRKQFGQQISAFQAVSHRIADMKVAIELSRLMMYHLAGLKDQRKSTYLETSIFKLFVSENYISLCREAMQIFGAYGYTKEYSLERELRDALASSVYSGTNEMQRNTIFRMINVDP